MQEDYQHTTMSLNEHNLRGLDSAEWLHSGYIPVEQDGWWEQMWYLNVFFCLCRLQQTALCAYLLQIIAVLSEMGYM